MNRRIYKKQCKRAAALISRHVPVHEQPDITLAEGDETMCPAGKFDEWTREELQKKRATRQGRRYMIGEPRGYLSPLKGTPIIWYRCNWEVEEYDTRCVIDWWREWDYYNKTPMEQIMRDHGMQP